jgi:hypothetical protein
MTGSRLRARAHRVTPDERAAYLAVELRDAGCVAPRLDPEAGPCSGRLTRQHVKDGPGGPRITDEAHLVMLCEHHHIWSGWATSKAALALQRAYLASLHPEAWPRC